MTDYKKLSEIISSSIQNLKNALEGKVSTSELLQQSILQQQLAKETAKKDLEERKRLKEEERKALEEIKENEPVAVNINPSAEDGRKRKRGRGRPKGSKNKRKKNIDDMTDDELLTEFGEDYANFSFKRGDETKQDPIPFSKPKRKSNKGKNKNKDRSFTRKLIEDARASLYQDGQGIKKKKSNKKIPQGSKKLIIDKKRQNLIVELNLLMGSIRSGSSNKKMNERVKTILKQLITE